MNTRAPYSLPQLRACLAVAIVRYKRAKGCEEAKELLRSQHALRDRISFTEFMQTIGAK